MQNELPTCYIAGCGTRYMASAKTNLMWRLSITKGAGFGNTWTAIAVEGTYHGDFTPDGCLRFVFPDGTQDASIQNHFDMPLARGTRTIKLKTTALDQLETLLRTSGVLRQAAATPFFFQPAPKPKPVDKAMTWEDFFENMGPRLTA